MERFSRREFFEKFIPKGGQESERKDTFPSETEKIWSRRNFLEFLIGLSVALLTGGIETAQSQEKDREQKFKDKEVKEHFAPQQTQMTKKEEIPLTSEKEIEEKGDSYIRTVIETQLMLIGENLANKVLRKLGLEPTRPLSEKEWQRILENTSIEDIIEAVLLAPGVEETLFRLIPSKFIDMLTKDKKSHRWEIGIPVSILFALCHKLGEIEEELKSKKTIPLSQFMGGVFLWYLMRERGFSHAVLAHSIHNATVLAIAKLLYKIFPKKTESSEIEN
jgi:hypothetical protein